MHIAHVDVGNLRDVDQPRLPFREFDKSTKIRDARDNTLYYAADFNGQNKSSLQR